MNAIHVQRIKVMELDISFLIIHAQRNVLMATILIILINNAKHVLLHVKHVYQRHFVHHVLQVKHISLIMGNVQSSNVWKINI